ncbi:MAG: Uxx-star family glutaredoxin-like (seleno)protein [Actinomycetota bacterium]|nr:Uxx-star family glutaredoxin-like (seleno)protein [Actinomycetota bacterium]
MAEKVKVYSTPTCPYCVQVKEYLKTRGIEFEDFGVASDADARSEMVEKSGQMGVPVIVVGDEIVVGFDRSRLDTLIT